MMYEKSIRNLAMSIINHFREVTPNGVGWCYTHEQCIDLGDFIVVLNLN